MIMALCSRGLAQVDIAGCHDELDKSGMIFDCILFMFALCDVNRVAHATVGEGELGPKTSAKAEVSRRSLES